jgi:hypothetical protein
MEVSKSITASTTPTRDHKRCDVAINKDDTHKQKDAKDGDTSNERSQQGIIEDEKTEPTTQEITATKSSGAESTGKDYSSFGPWQKKGIVFAATMGAFFSPFTTQIYFPALTTIAKELHVSNSKINLTMTTYMVRHPLLFPRVTS